MGLKTCLELLLKGLFLLDLYIIYILLLYRNKLYIYCITNIKLLLNIIFKFYLF